MFILGHAPASLCVPTYMKELGDKVYYNIYYVFYVIWKLLHSVFLEHFVQDEEQKCGEYVPVSHKDKKVNMQLFWL